MKRLSKHLEERRTKDTALMQAKRDAVESKEAVARMKAIWDNKLAKEQSDFEASRRETQERVARYEAKLAEQAKQIKLLQEEVASLKAVTAPTAPRAPAPVPLPPAVAETLPSLLRRLHLEAHQSTFDDEELDVDLLRSMGRDELTGNMAELGLSTAEAARLADALFPVAVS